MYTKVVLSPYDFFLPCGCKQERFLTNYVIRTTYLIWLMIDYRKKYCKVNGESMFVKYTWYTYKTEDLKDNLLLNKLDKVMHNY